MKETLWRYLSNEWRMTITDDLDNNFLTVIVNIRPNGKCVCMVRDYYTSNLLASDINQRELDEAKVRVIELADTYIKYIKKHGRVSPINQERELENKLNYVIHAIG